MLGIHKAHPISEREAEGTVAAIYHEIRQVMRVSGINLNFRTWAAFPEFFSLMWEGARPVVETRQFEENADELRKMAVMSAAEFPRPGKALADELGESQHYQLRSALTLYHYINPKLLLLTSAVMLALEGEKAARDQQRSDRRLINRGVPSRMYPMEMVDEKPDDKRIRRLFKDIKKTLDLPAINSDYRTLALWPQYLEQAWSTLKPIVQSDKHRMASDELREESRRLAQQLPLHLKLSSDQITAAGDDPEAVKKKTKAFEQLLPGLILNVAWLGLEGQSADDWARSPFPASVRQDAEVNV